MVSVEKWKEHFKQMAHREYPNEDMYIVNQRGRGIGRNAYKKTTYKVRAPKRGAVNIVSPVAQTVQRARALMKNRKQKKPQGRKKGIKRRAPSTSRSRPAKRPRGRTTQKKSSKKKRKTKAQKKSPSHRCPCPATVRIKPKKSRNVKPKQRRRKN